MDVFHLWSKNKKIMVVSLKIIFLAQKIIFFHIKVNFSDLAATSQFGSNLLKIQFWGLELV